jgi:hypothetical protein
MSSHFRVIALLIPALALVAAEGDPAPAPAPAAEAEPAAKEAKAKPVPAADDGTLNNLDLRLTFGGGGELSKIKNEDTDVETDYEEGSGGTVAIHVIYLRARPGGVGFAVGGGLFAHSYEGDPEGGGPTSTVNAAGIDVYAAFVWRPTRNWHFELPAVVLSGGSAKVETDGADDSERGGYARFAAQLGAYYTFDFGLQLGLDLGAAGFGATIEDDTTNEEFTFTGGGGYLNLSAGYRF